MTEADVSAGTFYNLHRTKAGVLTELTEFMFQNQFTIAGQIVQGETDPVKLYAVETAIQLTLAELNENLRQIYVEAQHAAGKFGNHPQDDGRDAAPYFRRVYARVQ